jgi:hypothetical protein
MIKVIIKEEKKVPTNLKFLIKIELAIEAARIFTKLFANIIVLINSSGFSFNFNILFALLSL